MSREEFELGYQGERRKQRLRAVALCTLLFVVITACTIAAYHVGWSSCANSADLRSFEELGRYRPIREHVLYIGVSSAPGNFQKRELVRQAYANQLAKAYPGVRIKLEFLIGQVPIQENNMSSSLPMIATEEERLLEERLQEEADWHQDISRIPVVESAVFETEKVLWLLRNAVAWRARYLLKTTDDQKVVVADVLNKVQTRRPTARPVYFGKVWIPHHGLEGDGNKSWFFDGKCYGISGDLAYTISTTHFNHSIAFPLYGTNADDVNMAKWIQFEDNLRKEQLLSSVERLWLPTLCHSMVQFGKAL